METPPLNPSAGTDRQRMASPDDAHPVEGDSSSAPPAGGECLPNHEVHPAYSVSVTPSKGPWQAAYVGQAIQRIDGQLYGGTLCTVTRADPAEANRVAQWIAAAWNATGGQRQ